MVINDTITFAIQIDHSGAVSRLNSKEAGRAKKPTAGKMASIARNYPHTTVNKVSLEK